MLKKLMCLLQGHLAIPTVQKRRVSHNKGRKFIYEYRCYCKCCGKISDWQPWNNYPQPPKNWRKL